jgi:hypothetical protein
MERYKYGLPYQPICWGQSSKELRITLPPYTILQILSLIQFEKMSIMEALAANSQIVKKPIFRKQLFLFD